MRFVVTTRSGRIDQLQLPQNYAKAEVETFTQAETDEYIQGIWPRANQVDVEDFHSYPVAYRGSWLTPPKATTRRFPRRLTSFDRRKVT